MSAGAWITIGVLVLVVVFLLLAILAPKLKKYKLQSPLKKIEPKKRRVAKKTRKKGKYLQIRIQ